MNINVYTHTHTHTYTHTYTHTHTHTTPHTHTHTTPHTHTHMDLAMILKMRRKPLASSRDLNFSFFFSCTACHGLESLFRLYVTIVA
jgi:hypothetical protein